MSHPTWVRGLKRCFLAQVMPLAQSHPTWVRGLKPRSCVVIMIFLCRTLRGCVD